MSKSLKLNIRILDIDRLEEMKRLINELLDIIETLRITATGNEDDNSFEMHEVIGERRKYINRFADIITDE